jgi:uncharacterized protein YndB with AHSA1/START domain
MKTIHHVVDIDGPVDSVWSAITLPEKLTRWWSTEMTTVEPAVGVRLNWTFADDFNPVMEIVELNAPRELEWRCVGGHDPWQDGIFRFHLVELEDGRTRLRFWQDYAVELSDDAYGIYNFNWGYYLESLRLLCTSSAGRPFRPAR